jgi:hypothetical protein
LENTPPPGGISADVHLGKQYEKRKIKGENVKKQRGKKKRKWVKG